MLEKQSWPACPRRIGPGGKCRQRPSEALTPSRHLQEPVAPAPAPLLWVFVEGLWRACVAHRSAFLAPRELEGRQRLLAGTLIREPRCEEARPGTCPPCLFPREKRYVKYAELQWFMPPRGAGPAFRSTDQLWPPLAAQDRLVPAPAGQAHGRAICGCVMPGRFSEALLCRGVPGTWPDEWPWLTPILICQAAASLLFAWPLAEKTWTLLENAIQEINNHNASGLSFEELYRWAGVNCLGWGHGELVAWLCWTGHVQGQTSSKQILFTNVGS